MSLQADPVQAAWHLDAVTRDCTAVSSQKHPNMEKLGFHLGIFGLVNAVPQYQTLFGRSPRTLMNLPIAVGGSPVETSR